MKSKTYFYSARLCGDLPKANKYISKARMMAGEIYDLADPDSGNLLSLCALINYLIIVLVSAMLMMSNYWQLVLNIPLCAHYTRLANSLRRLV
jgi:hypothetical protein